MNKEEVMDMIGIVCLGSGHQRPLVNKYSMTLTEIVYPFYALWFSCSPKSFKLFGFQMF
jgi:hypothetical protein